MKSLSAGRMWLSASLFMLVLGVRAAAAQAAAPRFDLPRDDFLIDEAIPIVVSGVTPGASVTIRVRGGVEDAWTANATFTADRDGRVDLTHLAPTKSSEKDYKDVDAMGLFWSAERTRAAPTDASADEDADESTSSERWTLTAEIGNAIVARAAIHRRAVAQDVRVTAVRTDGLVGVFYEPAGGGRHPAMLVLSGSGGGIPPASGPAGGLASHGYAVLALAYFGVAGLPSTLSNIPLEYFGTALRWMSRQPSVDTARIGVLGGSRGAELALLLGSAYPDIHTVIAYMPSNVVWRGCCDPSAMVAWTVHGQPLAAMPAPNRQVLGRRGMGGGGGGGGGGFGPDLARVEIHVEQIHGAVLLIAGKDDGVWDSAPMAEKIVARLKHNNFQFPVSSLIYDHAGHSIGRPYASTMNLNKRRHPVSGRVMHLGGTPAGTAKAREDSWSKMLAFVDQHLRAN